MEQNEKNGLNRNYKIESRQIKYMKKHEVILLYHKVLYGEAFSILKFISETKENKTKITILQGVFNYLFLYRIIFNTKEIILYFLTNV